MISRRDRIYEMIPLELLIREVIKKVEEHEAHPLLTETINFLHKAKDKVFDWYDDKIINMTARHKIE